MRSTPNVDDYVLMTDDDGWSALHTSRWVVVFRYSIPLSLPFPPFLRYAAAEDGEERSADLRDHGYEADYLRVDTRLLFTFIL